MKKRFLLYVVMDMSESMTWPIKSNDPNTNEKLPIDVAMDIVPSIIKTAKNDSTVSSALRISVLGFNETAFTLFGGEADDIETKDPQALNAWWLQASKESLRHKCAGQTYYSALFDKLCETIKRDQRRYGNSAEYELGRPVVYFLTDGKWEGKYETEGKVNAAYKRLVSETDHKAPIILVIGIGDKVSIEDIGKYGAGRVTANWEYDAEKGKRVRKFYPSGDYLTGNDTMAFILKGDNQLKVLPPLNKAVIQSIVNSINSRSSRGPIPRNEPDFRRAFEQIDGLIDNEEVIR